ncbi:hypothetical protein DFH06DRAFT_1365586 [Mycena polygramma]|nr:hypothetical protein DFH06DRAFT_1365586 [Mycena polygramma]
MCWTDVVLLSATVTPSLKLCPSPLIQPTSGSARSTSGKTSTPPRSTFLHSTSSSPTSTSSRPTRTTLRRLCPSLHRHRGKQLSAHFITHLFACPPFHPQSTHAQTKLPYFIAYALHRTKLRHAVTYGALLLLQRLKIRFPTARGLSGHRLFISVFMIAAKIMCDDTYSNKSWTIVAQGMFTLHEINQMEREVCNYLDWEFIVDNLVLSNFEAMVNHDFAPNAKGPYPTYSLHMVSKCAAKAAASASASATPIPEPDTTTIPIPAFGQQHQATPTKAYPALPPSIMPPPFYSNTTSPASSISPPTPTGLVDLNAKIHDGGKSNYEMSPGLALSSESWHTHPLKAKMFAFATPAIW